MKKALQICVVFFTAATSTLQGGEVVQRFVHHYVDSDPDRPFDARFLGVQTMQHPADMWMFQEIITELQPDLIIETGTAYGGSALFFASVLERVNPGGRVITIDLDPRLEQSIEGLRDRPSLYDSVRRMADGRIEVITSDSLNPQLLERLRRRAKGKTVLVTLDSCHHAQHVLREMEAYGELVSVGSYLIVQDTIIDQREDWIERFAGCPGYEDGYGGPGKAVAQFLASRSDFVVDRDRERYLLTFYPSGYLKRVR